MATPNDMFNDEIELLKDIGTKLSDFEEVPNDYEKFTLLGKGNFGYAEKMKSKKDNKFYAIKKLDINSKKFKIKDFKRETEIMKELNHENIIRLYGYFKDKEDKNKYNKIYKIDEAEDKEVFCLVLEYAENGSLENYMKKYKKKFKNENEYVPMEEKTIIKIFKQILSAVKYLHSKSIMYRDIKQDNILLEKTTI
jgi:serine/threonine protein kinase